MTLTNTHLSRRAILVGLGAGLAALALPRGLAAQEAGGTLRFGLSTFPPSLSPFDNVGGAANTVKLSIHRGLMGYNAAAELQPELAESYDWEDETTVTFRLRDNAVFHNGDPVTAADVIHSLEEIRKEGSTAFLRSDLAIIDGMEAVDDKTVRITLTSPSAVFLNLLANYCAPVISAKSTAEDIIGCGPFQLSGQERGVFIEVTAFPDFYTEGEPGVGGIRFIVYADENLRYSALEAGDVDLIEYLPWSQFATVEASDQMEMHATSGPFMFLLFNVAQEGPLKDPRVRQAIGYAIERQDIVDAAFAGYGTPLYGFPNPEGSTVPISDEGIAYSYDMERAMELLAEAGYPNGFDCRLLGTATYGMHQDTASVVQAYLAMIGINATLDLPDWGSRVTAGTEGRYDIAVHGASGTFNDPDALFSMLYSGNPSYLQSYGFKSERIDSLLLQGRNEPDPEKRRAIYQDLAAAYYEEVPQVPLNWRTQAHASRGVSGFAALPGFLNGSSGFSLDEAKLD
ncbi:ABC transporter substrate-binding protein [Falsirhodobacter halotolerans]|uniref:ABC transporter substrate-binding protein n=1 Tax=Falsirhodobacter halotolerans TaxID=1146892 RepID=UPI001FD1479B|nr:ABC transporter substrate-binding protein [Falsirhodobacter halotolerans]MCJ8139037.1 ABC transporter substrate-binding protein [Falsirhodobacter halotolerans]